MKSAVVFYTLYIQMGNGKLAPISFPKTHEDLKLEL